MYADLPSYAEDRYCKRCEKQDLKAMNLVREVGMRSRPAEKDRGQWENMEMQTIDRESVHYH